MQHRAKRTETVVGACRERFEQRIDDFMTFERVLAFDLQRSDFGLGASVLLEEADDVLARPEQRQDAVLHAAFDVGGKTHAVRSPSAYPAKELLDHIAGLALA